MFDKDKNRIKFFENHEDNMHCTHAVFRSLFDYYFDENFSWSEIDELTKTIPGKAAWTMAAHVQLAKRGLKVVVIEPFDYERFHKEGESYLRKNFNANTTSYYLNKSNLPQVKAMIPTFLEYVEHIKRKATIEDIDNFLREGYLVAAEVNSRILNSRPGFSLHYVLIKDFDGDNYIINDPGLPPVENRNVSKSKFMKALGEEGSNGEVAAFKLLKK